MRLLTACRLAVLLVPLAIVAPRGSLAANGSVEILIAAAASLAPYCQAMGQTFEARQRGVKVRFTFASSGHLRQQIEAGAPADGFISASRRQMDLLERSGLIRTATRHTLARNELVLIVPVRGTSMVRGFDDLARPAVTAVALGDPAHVPAGWYGRTVLQHLGLWKDVEPKLIYGLNARQVLQYVIQGEVDAGVVYRSDAQTAPEGVRVVSFAPEGSHPPITYPLAVIKDAAHPRETEAFFAFLRSSPGQASLIDYGLRPARPERSP